LLKYLKRAFWIRWPVPLLGALPVNAIASAIIAGLGFLNPGIWLIGIGAESAFLFGLATSNRFRSLVDARDAVKLRRASESTRQSLIHHLIPPDQSRLSLVEDKMRKVADAYARFAQNDPQAESNLRDLRKLAFFYLKLLLAKRHILSGSDPADLNNVPDEIAKIENDLKQNQLSSSARRIKEATLELLKKRLGIAEKRDITLEEINSDLQRIETQFDVALENAMLKANPSELTFQLDLSSRALAATDLTGYGSAFDAIEAEL